MVEIIMSIVVAFGITFYAIPAIIHAAQEKKLYDYPDERKWHHQPIPSLGGIGIFSGFITAFLLTASFEGEIIRFQYLLAAALVIFFVGLKDDLLNISPLKKFLGQVLAASIISLKGGLVIRSMEGLLGIYELPEMAAYLLTILTIVVIINAYNLIDGIDGLAAGLSIISSLFFALFFALNGDFAFACMATALIGALIAFLIFNAQPAKIFMGDTGSMMLGLLHAMMAIQFIATAPASPILSVSNAPAIAFAIMFVPLFDTLRVFSIRMLQGSSPFTPDRNHIHHILLRYRLSHARVATILCATGIIMPIFIFSLKSFGINSMMAIMAALGFSCVGILVWRYRVITSTRVVKGNITPGKSKVTKVRIMPAVGRKTAN